MHTYIYKYIHTYIINNSNNNSNHNDDVTKIEVTVSLKNFDYYNSYRGGGNASANDKKNKKHANQHYVVLLVGDKETDEVIFKRRFFNYFTRVPVFTKGLHCCCIVLLLYCYCIVLLLYCIVIVLYCIVFCCVMTTQTK